MYIKDEKYNPLLDRILVLVDILMVVLVFVNLTMLALQVNFESARMSALIQQYLPEFYDFYQPIFQNFIFIDGIFVSIFLVELSVRWLLAIVNKTYHHWFFYPFVNWYEVLGCIPVGSFRVLRVLRIAAVIIRLNRMKVIDIRQWYLYQLFNKYLAILTEEVSDRVVVNIIEGVQAEVKTGIPLTGKIIEEVVLPRKEILVDFIAHRVQLVMKNQYEANKDELRESINEAVSAAIQQNENIQLLEAVPLVGKAASSAIQQSVYDITFETINHIFEKFSTDESRVVIEKITDGIIEAILMEEEDSKLQNTVTEMVIHSLDLVKAQVKVQQWKESERNA
jgi:hypothetical protein